MRERVSREQETVDAGVDEIWDWKGTWKGNERKEGERNRGEFS